MMNLYLAQQWKQALNGIAAARALWQEVDNCGDWSWRNDGVCVKGTGPEWLGLLWQGWNEALLNEMKNFVIEVTVSGKAGAAGLSFGAFKDFLADVNAQTGPRRLQL